MADRRRLALIAALLAVALLLLALWLKHHDLPGDARLFDRLVDKTQGDRDWQLSTFFGDLAHEYVAICIVGVTALVLLRTVGWQAAAFVVAASAIGAANEPLRELIGPTQLGAQRFPIGPSFPSGHVAFATGYFGALALLGRAHKRPEAVWVSVAMIVAMGIARVHSASHLPSDALGGYLAGGAWLAGLLALVGPGVLKR